jgi:hypothetical protein
MKPMAPGVDGPQHGVAVVRRRQRHHRQLGVALAQQGNAVQTVHAGQAQVDQHQVGGRAGLQPVQALFHAAGLLGDEVGAQRLQQQRQAFAEQRMVVDEQDVHVPVSRAWRRWYRRHPLPGIGHLAEAAWAMAPQGLCACNVASATDHGAHTPRSKP